MKTFYLSVLFAFLMLSGCSSNGSSKSSNDKPTLTEFSGNVAENAAIGTTVGSITVDTGDSSVTVITLSGTGSTDFSVDTNGTITVANALDFETQADYNLTAVATNADGDSDPVSVTISIIDVDEIAPVFTSSAAVSVPETTTAVITLAATDSSMPVNFTINGTDAGLFTLTGDTLTFKAAPDFEAPGDAGSNNVYDLVVTATDAALNSATQNLAVTVTNVVELSPAIDAFAGAVDENATVGTVVGTITISGTGDAGIVNSIALNSADFLVEANGTITVAKALDFETNSFYNLIAVATNDAGGSQDVDVNITINNVPDVPPTLQPFTLTIADATSGHIGDINISDSGESTVIHGISLTGIGAEDFTVTPEGNISTTGTIDYKTRAIYKLTAVATSDAGDSAAVPVTIMVDIKRTAPAPETQDYFGSSVAVDGAYVVVGAEGNASKAGMAYVLYKDVTGTYSQVAELNASDATPGDKFGISVAISGDYVVVGAQLADTNATNAGAAYVFKRNAPDNNYSEIALLTASDPAADDHFGFSVAIDGAYVIVGADNKSSSVAPVGPSTGAAYIFKNNGDDTYTEVNKLTAFDHEPSDYFGWSVDINGDHAIVGAWSESMGGEAVISAGAAYVYKKDAGTGLFNHADKLMAPLDDAQTGDNFGWSVGIGANGEYAVVGAYHDNANQDSVDKNNTGAAYIFKNNGDDTYTQTTKLTASDTVADDLFGSAVSISGDYVLVGAKSEDPASDINGNRGAAHLFQNDGTGLFTEVIRFKAHDTGAGDYFGYSVAISGSDMVVGARSYTENIISEMGTVYLFNFELK